MKKSALCVKSELAATLRKLATEPTDAVKYAVDAFDYLMDAAGSSLLTEIYYLSQVRIT